MVQNRPRAALHERHAEDIATLTRNRKRNADNAIVWNSVKGRPFNYGGVGRRRQRRPHQ